MIIVPATSVLPHEAIWLAENSRGKRLIVEIGSCYGYSTVALATHAKKVIAVDDFKGCRDLGMSDEARGCIFDVFKEITKGYNNIEVDCTDHADYIPPIDCDMAFIDGDHSYENVHRDISRFLERTNLLLCGHDYTWWPGVKMAVDELLPGVEFFSDNLWFKQL